MDVIFINVFYHRLQNKMIYLEKILFNIRRRLFWKKLKANKKLSVGTASIHPSAIIYDNGRVSIGDDVYIGPRAYLSGNVTIGNGVMIGPNSFIIGDNHRFSSVGIRMIDISRKYDLLDVIIHDDVWVGCNCVLLGRVEVYPGAIIGAGSVVTRDVPPCSIVAGNPARFIKDRFNDEEMYEHLSRLGYDEDEISRFAYQRKLIKDRER